VGDVSASELDAYWEEAKKDEEESGSKGPEA
jgi:hypothetical protein